MNHFSDIEIIVSVVCNYFKITPEQLFVRSRKRDDVEPRQIYHYLCHRHTVLPLKNIGANGNFNHSTVLNSVKKVYNYMAFEKPFKKKVYTIEKIVKQSFTLRLCHETNVDYLHGVINKQVKSCDDVGKLNKILSLIY